MIGRSELLFETALLLQKRGFEIKFIITSKALPEYQIKESDFKKLSKRLSCDYFLVQNVNDPELIAYVKQSGVKIGVSVNHPTIIGRHFLKTFELGILNAHAGDLPRYRGNACLNWAILNGERFVGLVIHKMNPGQLDTGGIVAKTRFRLGANTYIGDIHAWLKKSTPELYLRALKNIKRERDFIYRTQFGGAKIGFRCYPRIPDDSEINWNLSAIAIHRLIRASSEPLSGAYAFYGGKKIIIWRADILDDKERYMAMPGQISDIDKMSGDVVVITGKSKLKITSVSTESDMGARQKPAEIIRSIRTRLESRYPIMTFAQNIN
jgi:methionyl-tRNA formyltransferase